MNKLPMNDAIKVTQRKNMAERRLGANAKCACGELRPEALVTGSNPIICYECLKRKRGQSAVEDHHFAGKSNSDVTVPVPANDHRAELSVAQMDWPKATLENHNGDPLLAGAAAIRGFTDLICYLIKYALLWIADMLEMQSKIRVEYCGPEWWHCTPMENFPPKRKKHENNK